LLKRKTIESEETVEPPKKRRKAPASKAKVPKASDDPQSPQKKATGSFKVLKAPKDPQNPEKTAPVSRKEPNGWSNAGRVVKTLKPKASKDSPNPKEKASGTEKKNLAGPQVSHNYVRHNLGNNFKKGGKKFGHMGW